MTKEGYWYDDKNYNQFYFKRFDGGSTSGRIARRADSMYDGDAWQVRCDTIRFERYSRSSSFNGPIPNPCPQGFCGPGLKIHTLTKSVFEYGDRNTLFNPAGDENGNITIKTDEGNYIFNKIKGMDFGANTIFKNSQVSGFKIVRFNDAFSQFPIKISVTDIDIDTITYPYQVPNEKLYISTNESVVSNSKLIITEFKNDTLKGNFFC